MYRGSSRGILGIYQNDFPKFGEVILCTRGISGCIPRVYQGCTGRYTKVYHRFIRIVAGIYQEEAGLCSRGVPGGIPGGIPWVFQGKPAVNQGIPPGIPGCVLGHTP